MVAQDVANKPALTTNANRTILVCAFISAFIMRSGEWPTSGVRAGISSHAFGGYLTGFCCAAAGQSLGPTRGTFVCHHIVFCFAMAGHRDGRFATVAQMSLN